ncbi:MAG: hypothetical protein WBD20_28205 [Pirellulaceae bacterium]
MNVKRPPDDDGKSADDGKAAPIHATQEQALDALLCEAYGASSPPDLSSAILSRLNDYSATSDCASVSDSGIQIAARPSARHASTRRRNRTSKRRYLAVIAAISALAASVAFVFFIRGFDQQTPIATKPTQSGSQQIADTGTTNQTIQQNTANLIVVDSPNDTQSLPNQGQVKPAAEPIRRGVPMIVQNDPSLETNQTDNIESTAQADSPKRTAVRVPIENVASQLQQNWQKYWQATGVTPSTDASAAEVADRMKQILGVQLSADSITNPKGVRNELVSEDVSREIALRWLASVTGNSADRLESNQFSALVDDAASAFRADEPLDERLIQWIRGDSDATSSFYNAFANDGHDSLVRQLASVTMDVDLRCTKCHDAMIEGNGRQESYWSFSSFLLHGLKRSRDGSWSVLAKDQASSKASFYELPDGRQRFTQPAVDATWVSNKPADDIANWANGLKRSPELAHGVVNSIWKMVHGRPLRGHVIDTIVAPHHQLLDDMQQQLAQDLIDSDFDVARTLALVITSPPSHRSVPNALLSKNLLMASDDVVRQSMQTVDAFAAALPIKADLPLSGRLAVAMKSVGGSLKDLEGGDQLLANIGASTSTKNDNRRNNQPTRETSGDDYPAKANQLPVQWLSSIKSYENQVRHLGYLANHENLPQSVMETAEALRDANASEPSKDYLALNRVWWLVRP